MITSRLSVTQIHECYVRLVCRLVHCSASNRFAACIIASRKSSSVAVGVCHKHIHVRYTVYTSFHIH
jgi:hypothetical protein